MSPQALQNRFVVKELKKVELSGWGAEYGAIEKIFFDAHLPTVHSSSGITICTGGEKSRIPLHYHNCETAHYILYGTGIMKSADGTKHQIKAGDAIYCAAGPEGAHNFENLDEFPLAIYWTHAYPEGTREDTVWVEKEEFSRRSIGPVKGSFVVKELKKVELSGWGAEYGAIEKIFFDAHLPTVHSSSGITICTGGEKSRIPLHYHNCETAHYILYGTGIMKSADGTKHQIKAGDAIYCAAGPEGAHNFENLDEFPLGIYWTHAYPEGTREDTVWVEKGKAKK